jgi:hypothetical protein
MSQTNLPALSYDSKDFNSIVADLNNYILSNYKEYWNDFFESNLGEALIDLLAYIGDQLNYYLDKRVNNLYWDTVERYDAVLRLCRLIGYFPYGPTGSKVDVCARLGGSVGHYTEYDWESPSAGVQRYFKVSGGHWGSTAPTKQTFTPGYSTTVKGLIFEVVEDTNIWNALFIAPPRPESLTECYEKLVVDNDVPSETYSIVHFSVYQGQTVQDKFTSDGTSFQQFITSRSSVIDGSCKLCVNGVGHDEGTPGGVSSIDGYIQATQNTFVLQEVGSHIYTVEYTDDSKIKITFGDGTDYGTVPPIGCDITIAYRIGGGFNTNIAGNVIKPGDVNVSAELLDHNGGSPIIVDSGVTLVVNNYSYQTLDTVPVYYGGRGVYGADRELMDKIKIRAPRSIKTTGRAITKDDIQSLVEAFSLTIGSTTKRISKAIICRPQGTVRYVDVAPDSPTLGEIFLTNGTGRVVLKWQGQNVPIYVPSYACNIVQIYVWQVGPDGNDALIVPTPSSDDETFLNKLRDYLNKGNLLSGSLTDVRLGDVGMTSVFYSVNPGTFTTIDINLDVEIAELETSGVLYDPAFKATGSSGDSIDEQIDAAIDSLFVNKSPGVDFRVLDVWRAVSAITGVLQFGVLLHGGTPNVKIQDGSDPNHPIASIAQKGVVIKTLIPEN